MLVSGRPRRLELFVQLLEGGDDLVEKVVHLVEVVAPQGRGEGLLFNVCRTEHFGPLGLGRQDTAAPRAYKDQVINAIRI